jgi:hypothetical protein
VEAFANYIPEFLAKGKKYGRAAYPQRYARNRLMWCRAIKAVLMAGDYTREHGKWFAFFQVSCIL